MRLVDHVRSWQPPPRIAIPLTAASLALVATGTAPGLGATSQPEPFTLTPDSAVFGELETGATSEQVITATNSGPAPAPTTSSAPDQPPVEICGNDVDDDGDDFVDETPGCVEEAVTVETCCPPQPFRIAIRSVGLTGSAAFAEVDDGCAGLVLEPGETCDVRVTFSPTEVGELAASLEFVTSAGDVTAELSGVGVSPVPATTEASAPTTAENPTPTPQAPSEATTPTSAGASAVPGGPGTPPPGTVPIVDRGERDLWWPVAASILLVAGLLVAPHAWARRGPKWVRTHVRAVAGPGVDGCVEIVRPADGPSPPTCVVGLEPHADPAVVALLEVDR
jgi:hypothetical protein